MKKQSKMPVSITAHLSSRCLKLKKTVSPDMYWNQVIGSIWRRKNYERSCMNQHEIDVLTETYGLEIISIIEEARNEWITPHEMGLYAIQLMQQELAINSTAATAIFKQYTNKE